MKYQTKRVIIVILVNNTTFYLFDKGLITFGDDKRIKISQTITKENMARLGIDNSMSLRKIDKKHQSFLAYHRDNIFI